MDLLTFTSRLPIAITRIPITEKTDCMLKTAKVMFHLFMKDMHTSLLKFEISRKIKTSRSKLWDKTELRNALKLIESLDQQRRRTAI